MSARPLLDVPIRAGVFVGEDFRAPAAALRGTRCARCAETFFPARRVCARCHAADRIEETALGRRGRVFALTHVVRPAGHYAAPYVLALVDLPEGVRVLSQIAAAPDTVAIGDEVTLVVEPLFDTPEGQRVWGYRFAPVGAGR